MTFIKYLKLNKDTIYFGLKITGLIFSIFTLIILFLKEDLSNTFYAIKMMIVCIIIGNLFGVFIIFLAAVAGYTEAKPFLKFYNQTSDEFKNHFGIVLTTELYDKRLEFSRFVIEGTKNNTLLRFDFDHRQNSVLLTLRLDYSQASEEAFYDAQKKIKKYKKQSVRLTGWGLQKAIKLKEWRKMNIDDIDEIFKELYDIAINEKIVTSNNENETDIDS